MHSMPPPLHAVFLYIYTTPVLCITFGIILIINIQSLALRQQNLRCQT